MITNLTPAILREGIPVKAGQVICRQEPGSARIIGPGATLRSDGYTVLACTSGLAMSEKDRLWVYPATIYPASLVRGRPLTVSGNLIILGSVRSGAVVRASGELGVLGEVTSADLESSGSCVLLSGCSHSAIRVGIDDQFYETTTRKLEALHGSMERLLKTLEQLKGHPRFSTYDLETSLQPLLEILVERSLSAVPGQIREAIERCGLYRWQGRTLAELEEFLSLRFAGSRLLTVNRLDVERLRDRLEEGMAQLLAKRVMPKDLTVVGDVTQTTMHVFGVVRVLEGSSYNCQVEARIGFEVDGDIEDGYVFASEWVQASRISGFTGVHVNAGGVIEGRRIQGGAMVTVGKHSTRLPHTLMEPRIWDEGERLVVALREEM
ncbi:MAG: hypothetical protein ACOY94_19145 [Bacillota bacterium]